MLNLCGIVVAILNMATARNFSMSGINLGHSILHFQNFQNVCHFQNGCKTHGIKDGQ
jgi:hypothetical protein